MRWFKTWRVDTNDSFYLFPDTFIGGSLHRIFTEKTEKHEKYADSLRRIFPEESYFDSLLSSYAEKTPIPQRHGVERRKHYNTIAQRSGLEANDTLLGLSSQQLLSRNSSQRKTSKKLVFYKKSKCYEMEE